MFVRECSQRCAFIERAADGTDWVCVMTAPNLTPEGTNSWRRSLKRDATIFWRAVWLTARPTLVGIWIVGGVFVVGLVGFLAMAIVAYLISRFSESLGPWLVPL